MKHEYYLSFTYLDPKSTIHSVEGRLSVDYAPTDHEIAAYLSDQGYNGVRIVSLKDWSDVVERFGQLINITPTPTFQGLHRGDRIKGNAVIISDTFRIHYPTTASAEGAVESGT